MHYIYEVPHKPFNQYRVYYLHQKKKIYIGLYDSTEVATKAFMLAKAIMNAPAMPFSPIAPNLPDEKLIPFKKYITLINFRDNHILINNPIYIYKDYFKYYLSFDLAYIFDMKDLLFFSTTKIYKRGNYLYTKNATLQTSLLNRYGIKSHATVGIDYQFKNGDCCDFRRCNLEILTSYYGVSSSNNPNNPFYITRIFTDKTIVVGHYNSELEAGIAYNKACDILEKSGIKREYTKNEFAFLTKYEYDHIYSTVPVSPRLILPHPQKKVTSSKVYRGVCRDKNGFKALIGYKGQQIYLGRYPTEKRAAQAYNLASFYLYGKQGHINLTKPLTYNGDEINIAKKLERLGLLKNPV